MGITFDWTFVFLAVFIASIFVVDGVRRARLQNAWKRRWKESD